MSSRNRSGSGISSNNSNGSSTSSSSKPSDHMPKDAKPYKLCRGPDPKTENSHEGKQFASTPAVTLAEVIDHPSSPVAASSKRNTDRAHVLCKKGVQPSN